MADRAGGVKGIERSLAAQNAEREDGRGDPPPGGTSAIIAGGRLASERLDPPASLA